jgi:hypothetical protein
MSRKIFSILIVLLVFSCSSSDDSTQSSSAIDPPEWILGTWLLEDSGLGDMGWRFTSNDFIMIQSGFEVSQKGQIEIIISGGGEASVENISTDDTYEIRTNFPGGQTTSYKFIRVSETELQWENVASITYIKQ